MQLEYMKKVFLINESKLEILDAVKKEADGVLSKETIKIIIQSICDSEYKEEGNSC